MESLGTGARGCYAWLGAWLSAWRLAWGLQHQLLLKLLF